MKLLLIAVLAALLVCRADAGLKRKRGACQQQAEEGNEEEKSESEMKSESDDVAVKKEEGDEDADGPLLDVEDFEAPVDGQGGGGGAHVQH